MPKESRRCGSRGSNRQRSCDDSDDGKKSSLRDTPKISGNSVNRYAPFQRDIPRRESRSNEEESFTTLVRSNEKTGGFIENGMKYIMFPLHLLRFCIFGTTTLSVDDGKSKDRKGIEDTERKSEDKREEREIRGEKNEMTGLREKEDKDKVGRRSNDSSKKSSKDKSKSRDVKSRSEERRDSEDRRKSNDSDDRVRERGGKKERSRSNDSRKSFSPRRADDDSDSSSCDKWSTAESSMDVSIEYESTYESMSYRLEEPMDISIEESIDENVLSSTRIVSHRTGITRVGPSSSSSSSSWSNEEGSSSSSIEEEISRAFQKKCSSSDDDDSSSSTDHRDKRRDISDRRDRKDREDVAPRETTVESKEKSNREGGTKSTTRRKDESCREKTIERRSTSSTTSSKNNSSPRRASRTPVKSKDTRKRYKEKGVQTDSAFSDDDVEMVPLDARLTEKRTSNRGYRRKPLSASYQMEGMDQDILYIADNEDSNDGCGRTSWSRVSPVSESSSSTDLGFEDQRCLTRNCRIQVDEKARTKSPLCDDTRIKDLSKKVPLSRAPPGFPKVPQNPPISLKSWNNQSLLDVPFATETNLSISQYGQSYPPAPMPMRHLYHEYPEFMPFPEEIGSLQIFKTTSTNGYLC